MSMTWWMWTLIGVYLIGFVFFFWFNIAIGPITTGLAFWRAIFWPIWIMTSWPHGTPHEH